jgi:hypothetical protein
MAAGEAQRDRRAHGNAAGDETLEAGLIGGGETSSANIWKENGR